MSRLLCITVAVLIASAWGRPSTPDIPSQIHLAQGNVVSDQVVISFTTNHYEDGYVSIGVRSGIYDTVVYAKEPAFRYNYTNAVTGLYTSPLIHHITVDKLQQDVRYYYVCGTQSGGQSQEYSFVNNPLPNSNHSVTLAFIGDLGQTDDSMQTRNHVLSDPSMTMTIIIGDLSYADSEGDPYTEHKPCTQTRWDSWGVMMEPLLATRPMMALPGNHEIEQQGGPPATQEKFLAFQSRFRMPSTQSGATNGNLYYSFMTGPAKVIMLNSYMDYSEGSEQYNWLVSQLKAVDRSVTPWVICGAHAPWYNSNDAHHNEVEEIYMRKAMEPLFHQYGVDLMFAGHVHAYERMFPVYNGQRKNGATVYINIGDGGNREGHAATWETQPDYSAYRGNHFGHGRLVISNATHAEWGWHSIDEAESVVSDSVILVKNSALPGRNHLKGVNAYLK